MVLDNILESPLYNKEIKLVNLKGNQPLTPAFSVETSTEGLQVERTNASEQNCLTIAAPSKDFVPPPLEEAQKG